jgi:hypothetical protein
MPARRPVNLFSPVGRDELDRLVDRFESAWQSGTPPEIEDFLPAGPAAARPLLYELVKIDLEYRWRRSNQGAAGRTRGGPSPSRPCLEFYVKQIPRLGPLQQLPVDLIGEEYRVRQCWGDRPAQAEYAARFPKYGTMLQATLERIDAELHAEMATDIVRGVSAPGAAGGPHSQSGSALLRCAHCGQAVEVGGAPAPPNPACPVCGAAFSVGVALNRLGPDRTTPVAQVGALRTGRSAGDGGVRVCLAGLGRRVRPAGGDKAAPRRAVLGFQGGRAIPA